MSLKNTIDPPNGAPVPPFTHAEWMDYGDFYLDDEPCYAGWYLVNEDGDTKGPYLSEEEALAAI